MVLLAKDIMDPNPLSLDEGTDALACAKAMVERHKGYAIVTSGPKARLAGIVTEWDLVSKVMVRGVDPSKVVLKDLATSEVQACGPETPTDQVVARMADLGVRRMVVRSGDELLGIITARNVLSIFRAYVDKLSSEIAGYQSTQTPLG